MDRKKIAAISALASWLGLTFGIHAGWFVSFDLAATILLQQIFPRVVDVPFSVLSYLGSAELTTGLFLVIVFLLARPAQRIPLLIAFAAMTIIELVGKTIVRQVGPPHEFFRLISFFPIPSGNLQTNYSYPSGHAARWTFLTMVLTPFIAVSRWQRRLKNMLLALVWLGEIAMLVSRPYLGEHWTTDVIGGALLAVAFTLPLTKNQVS